MRRKLWNDNTICVGCKNKLVGEHNVYREYKNGIWTRKWLCNNCYVFFRRFGTYEKPKKVYNKTNTCDACKNERLEIENALKEYDEKGIWTGRWLCHKCGMKNYYHKDKYRCDNQKNVKKSLANRRTGNLDPNCTNAIGDKFQLLTKIWRSTVSTIPVEDMNEMSDDYNTPIDHSLDSELGTIQTKGAFLGTNGYYEGYAFCTRNEHGKSLTI